MRRILLSTAAVAAAMIAIGMSSARAGLLVEESVGNSGFTTLCSAASGGSCAGSATTGGVAFTLTSGLSNSPGTATLADLLSDAVSITNNGTSPTPAMITLLIGDTGFTAPTAPPDSLTFESAIGTTVVIAGSANTLSYISCIDSGDGQNVCPGTNSTAAVTPEITTVGSSNESDSVTVNSLAGPYSVTEELQIALSTGSDINYSASSRLDAVPEPGTIAILGPLLIGIGHFASRKQNRHNANRASVAAA